jgi:hypothetical protein
MSEFLMKILRNPHASKQQLREALAASLGVEITEGKTDKQTLFSQCKRIFDQYYSEFSGLPYAFGAKDGVALAAIIKKIEALSLESDEQIIRTFEALISKLPDWYKNNAFSLTVINKKFNEIITSIKRGSGNTASGISADYRAQIARDLLA